MRAIIKRELRGYLRFPIYWIGIIIIFFEIYQNVSPYLKVHYFTQQEEIKEDKFPDTRNYDIMEGSVPSTPEQQKELGDALIRKVLLNEVVLPEEEVNQLMSTMKEMTIEESMQYLAEYGYSGLDIYYEYYERHQGNVEEANAYIEQSLQEHPFSYYFSMKFADFCGLFMAFFAIELLAFLYLRDTRRDMYELLHTKPIASFRYVLGKIFGGFLAMAFGIVLMNLIFIALCLCYGYQNGVTVNILDFVNVTFCYLLPNMLMIVCVYTIVAFVFHNPLPALPLLVLYLIYSNMGSYGPDGSFDYYGRLFAIMVRFPGDFFEISPPPMALLNQFYLIIASISLMIVSVVLWKRKCVV